LFSFLKQFPLHFLLKNLNTLKNLSQKITIVFSPFSTISLHHYYEGIMAHEKPDIFTLLRTGHFSFVLTLQSVSVDSNFFLCYKAKNK